MAMWLIIRALPAWTPLECGSLLPLSTTEPSRKACRKRGKSSALSKLRQHERSHLRGKTKRQQAAALQTSFEFRKENGEP